MNIPANVSRRTFLFAAMVGVGVIVDTTLRPLSAAQLLVDNVTGLYGVAVARIVQPSTTQDVATTIRTWPGQVAIGGGRFSMGGQVGVAGGLHLDMRQMKRMVWFQPQQRRIRVQAGMSWRDLQEIIDPHQLSVMTMQSYANFTAGGSVAVNAHGRYVGNGPICNSVQALQLVLADGSIVEANRLQYADLFRAAIGGYGAIGVITEVELDLTDNVRIERLVSSMPLSAYRAHFESSVRGDPASVLHNADLVPPLYDRPIAITWKRTDKSLSQTARLTGRGQSYVAEHSLLWALTELPMAEHLQTSVVRPMLFAKPMVTWRNLEASQDVAQLEPLTRKISTYVLQEYFIPLAAHESFARKMAQVLQRYKVVALNVSIRHSPADTVSLMPWAATEVFSFVLYYKQRSHRGAQEETGRWTRALIDIALDHGGRYYLPYQLHATKAQFYRAYPEAAQLRWLKQRVDPAGKFSNEMWRKYL